MADQFRNFAPGLESPASNAVLVTPDDNADLTDASRALWIGTAGDLTVTMLGGQTLTFPNLLGGWHPIRVTRVHATGTAASGIVAVW
jgi:hypothetical protein